MADEVASFNELLDAHHYLGHNLVGRVLRYVAEEDNEWVALIGFGSPALSLRAREAFVGWSEQVKTRRLRFVLNNQRLCILPGHRHNLASFVLARTLARLSADAEATYGDPVLLVETFTDPARHRGICYKAANFVHVGTTSGYGRSNGSWVHHGVVKACWLYPLRRDAAALLKAPFDHPVLLAALSRRNKVIDLNTVVIEGDGGLYARLCLLPDHRKLKGVRHKLAAVLLVCAAAQLCGATGPREIYEWARDLDDEARARLHCRRRPKTGHLVVPSESTIQRILRRVDREAFDRIVNETMRDQVMRRRAAPSEDDDKEDDPEQGQQRASRATGDGDGDGDDPAPRGLAVDGKSLRGAVQDDGRLVHLSRCSPTTSAS